MMTAKLSALPRMLAACLLAFRCEGAVLEQAPSFPVDIPTFEAITGPGYLQAINSNSCVANNNCANSSNVWITNMSAVQSNGQAIVTFAIAGGSNGLAYDVFATTTMTNPGCNAVWTWIGQGYQDITYALPALKGDSLFLLLGTPLDSDGDGLTDAYELLVSHSDPNVSNSINPSMLDGWAILMNMSPFAIYDQESFPNGPQVRLDYWRFNTNNYQSEAGLLPANANQISLVPSWSGTALCVTNLASWLSYPLAGPDGPSFDPTSGTIRFWFMPFYDPGTTNGSTFYGTFIDFGTGNNSWIFNLLNNEIHLSLGVDSSPLASGFFLPQSTVFQLQSNLWYQITLTYSPTNVAVYTNGGLYITSYLPPYSNSLADYSLGNGVIYTPSLASQLAGFSFGNNNNYDGGVPVNGLMDELEIFNYPLTPQAVAAGFPGFAGATYDVMADSDYDGRSDLLEFLADGTDPFDQASVIQCRLGYWRFDACNFMAEQGQLPLSCNDVSLAPSWSGTALNINSDAGSQVTYWDVFTNGWANINCRQGSLRFWFKPNWTGHPPASAPLVYMGNTNAAVSQWALSVNASGAVVFSTTSNSVGGTLLTSAPLPFNSGQWMQLVLNYGPSGTSLYTNGVLAATGSAVTSWPALSDRNLGLVIGNNTAYNNSINGQFDEMETFNYQLAPSNILSNFQTVQAVDTNLDGIPDVLEDIVLPASKSFLPTPVVVTGTIEAEQFDLGGPGIGYQNVAANPPSTYRPTGMCITNCNDLGLGYCLDQTRAGEWTQYTIDVLVAQTYTIEARVAGLGTNGVFECEFTGNEFYTNTGPLTITTTNWTNVAGVVYLTNGIYTMKLHCLANGSDGAHVGRFNYISIYPWWQVGFTSTHTNMVTAAELSPNNDFLDASNNAAVIQQAVNTLPAGGGTVSLPVGTYYVSQSSPNETYDAFANAAVTVITNNVEIAGAGKTSTKLIGYNRATTIFSVGQTTNGTIYGKQYPWSNFTLRDLTIEAQPHLAVLNVTNTTFELGQLIPRPDTGRLITLIGFSPSQLAQNVLITNCQFLYGDICVSVVQFVSNLLVIHCDFTIWGGTNVYTGATNNSPTNTANTTGYNGSVAIFGGQTPDYNINILQNTYNGNSNLVASTNNAFGFVNTTDGEIVAPDGFVWFQCGGNYFIARNTISNYALEGIQMSGGPNCVTGNTYNTLISDGSCRALVVNRSGAAAATGTNLINYSTFFIGNSVYGGRYGVTPNAVVPIYSINVSGNDLTLYPAFPADYPGAVVFYEFCSWANVLGNTLESGGHGLVYGTGCGNALIMDNNFANATYRGIGLSQLAQTGGSIQSVSIFNNILGQGSTFHVELPMTNSFAWFLRHNQYLNAAGQSMPPFLDPAGSGVHISN